MRQLIDPVDNSAVMDAIEAARVTPRELTEGDWELVEALAAAGGPDGDGDLMRWGQPSVERLIDLLELPGCRVAAIVDLLLLARRDDLAEALVQADDDRTLLAQLTDRAAEIDAERNRRAPRAKDAAPAAPPRTKGRQAGQADAERWQRAQAAPHEALAAVAEILNGDGTAQAKLRRSATLLGIRHRDAGQQVMSDAEVRRELNTRLQALGGETLEVAEAEAASQLARRWADCQQDPAAAIERVVAIRTGGGPARDRTLAAARALGIECRPHGGSRVPAAELRQAIAERLEVLEEIASGITTGPVIEAAPAAVVITPLPEPAPAAEPQTWVVESQVLEMGPWPELTTEMLLAEAWDHQPERSTLQDRLEAWEAHAGQDQDWRAFFGALSDFARPSAAAAISGATGVPTAEVQAWEATVRQRHQEDLAELRTAYGTLEALLADALMAPGWEWLSAGLTVRCDSLWARCRELSEPPAAG